MSFMYEFPAVKGIQAGREYYVTMVPIALLDKLFFNNDEIVPPEFRAQRQVNETRIPEITNYIVQNRDSYVFSALSASIDGNFIFVPSHTDNNSIGLLKIDMGSTLLINDGQHRRHALEKAVLEDRTLLQETISIVFFKDEGLKYSQQMFTDLNKHAMRTSNSLSTLYNSRDDIAVATRQVIDSVEFLKRYTDKEKDILGKNSSKLFTINNIYNANVKILKSSKNQQRDTEFMIYYWNCLANNIVEWKDLLEGHITKKDLRENYITTLAVTLNAFGYLGHEFINKKSSDIEKALIKLNKINWLRSNVSDWGNRVINKHGRVVSNQSASILICSKIKQLIGLKLRKEEELKEAQFIRGAHYDK